MPINAHKGYRKRLTGYPDIGNYAYGPIGRGIVNFFYNSVLIGVTTLYLILSGYNLQSLVGYLSQREWIILCGGLIWIPFILLRTLKEVSIVSLFGALASVLLVIIIIGLGLSDQSSKTKPSHDFIHFDSLATSICIIAFSFGGNFVYPEVEQSMKIPSKFPKVLRKAMIIITLMYLISSITGYAVYGNDVQSPITESLPKGLINTICKIVVTIHVLLACPVLMTTFALDIERAAHLDKIDESMNEYIQRIALRTASIMGVSLLAIVIPFFKDFMTLVGAMTNTMLIFIFPVIFHYKIFGAQHVSIWEHIFRGFIISMGIFSGVIGGWQAIKALYYDFLNTGGM